MPVFARRDRLHLPVLEPGTAFLKRDRQRAVRNIRHRQRRLHGDRKPVPDPIKHRHEGRIPRPAGARGTGHPTAIQKHDAVGKRKDFNPVAVPPE